MTDSDKQYLIPKVPDLARIVKVLGGTPTTYMPQGPKATELFTTACLATAAQARATKAAREAQRALAEAGADDELASLSKLTIVAMEEGDDRLDAVPQLWYWQISNIAVALRDLREQAPQADPLIKACADAARALMILLEARLNLRAEHRKHLTAVLAEAEEMLTSARSNTARLPHWLRQPGNLT